jgi:2-polyprenyl-3-methyl-5-hydroxy-6-metoxy-1,4-benzoquinol methylase
MGEPPMRMHRKNWEWSYIVQALNERGMLAPGKRGLGFAVGQEPLSAMFATLGCDIVATDLATEEAQKGKWVETNQHADSLKILNERGICSDEVLQKKVGFRFLDMRDLPDDLGKFDFIWSSCSLEHLGSMALGEKFIYESLKYLKPGGVAVHTTEYNVSSNLITFKKAAVIPFRKRDFQRIATKLRLRGCKIDLDFSKGNLPYDRLVDKAPYSGTGHLKMSLFPFVITSFGLIIET